MVVAHGAWAQYRNPDFQPHDFVNYADFSQITAITASSHFAYFATTNGIIRYDIFGDTWVEPLTGYPGLRGDIIDDIAVSFDDERLWATTNQGVYVWERVFGRWSPTGEIPADVHRGRYVNPAPIYNTPPGITYMQNGLFIDNNLRRYSSSRLYEDDNGFVWMGIQGYGAARYPANSAQLEILPFGLLQDWTITLSLVDNKLLIGGVPMNSARAGVTTIDVRTGDTRYYEQGLTRDFPRATITAFGSGGGLLYLGTEQGVFALDQNSGAVRETFNKFTGLPDDEVTGLVVVGDTVLVGTRYGLALILPDSTTQHVVSEQRLNLEKIFALASDTPRGARNLNKSDKVRPRYVYVGTDRGAYRMDMKTLKLQKLTSPDVFIFGSVRDLYRGGHQLWVLSEGGLSRLDVKNGETESLVEFSRITNPTAVAANDDIVAVGSLTGLDIVYLHDTQRVHRTYNAADGMPSNRVTDLEIQGEYLWIATDRGVSRFWWNDPSRID